MITSAVLIFVADKLINQLPCGHYPSGISKDCYAYIMFATGYSDFSEYLYFGVLSAILIFIPDIIVRKLIYKNIILFSLFYTFNLVLLILIFLYDFSIAIL